MPHSKVRVSASGEPLKVQCPICRLTIVFTSVNKFRPFCSARCREADLAAWASDHYQIQGAPMSQSSENVEGGRDTTQSDDSQ